MFDKSALTATAARDPLVTAFALFVLGGLATYFLFKTRPIERAIARIVFPTLLTIAFLRADIVPYQPLRSTGTPFRDVVHGGPRGCAVALGGLVFGRLPAYLHYR
jgi:hypothetical protein